MTLATRIVAHLAKLPPAQSYDVVEERDLAVPMPEGTVLRANRYYSPRVANAPVVLIRTPHGRSEFGILLVSSGSHPRYCRNLGTGEPLPTATRMVSAEQEIFHDPAHPSAIDLPVCRSAG